MIIKGFVIKEDNDDMDSLADGYIIIDKEDVSIKQNGKIEPFDKSLLGDVFSTKKTTKSKPEA